MSSRSNLIAATIAAWSQVRQGAYRVRRGPVNWEAWSFSRWPRGVSLCFHDEAFMRPDGFNAGTVEWQVLAQIPNRRADGEQLEVDDELMDQIHADAKEALRLLCAAKDSEDDSVLLKAGTKDAEILDTWDLTLGAQGKTVLFDVVY